MITSDPPSADLSLPPEGSDARETEGADPRFRDLETLDLAAILGSLLDGQARATRAVGDALAEIERAVAAAAERLRDPRSRLVYAGAGTSGRLAMLDGVELSPTFDWPGERTVFLLAGGLSSLGQAQEGAEDDRAAAVLEVAAAGIGKADVVLALAASGGTPYTVAVVEAARRAGALTVGFANNPETPLLRAAEHAVLLRTGPEVLAGSTRLAAGTAQKIALNLVSTAVMIRLGKVFRGRMVDMRATNDKLRRRAARMVADIAGCPERQAEDALRRTGYDIKRAILLAEGGDGRRESDGCDPGPA